VTDNLLTRCKLVGISASSSTVALGYNGFWNNAVNVSGAAPGPGNVYLTLDEDPFSHIGEFFLKQQLEQQDFPLVNAGSIAPRYAGLRSHATSVDAIKDAGELDIGYHYPHLYFADGDGDGMPDAWEQKWQLNPNDPSDATGNPDSDGLNNLQEYQAGSKPKVSDTDSDGPNDGLEVNNATMDPAWPSFQRDPYIIRMKCEGSRARASLTVKWYSATSYQGQVRYRKGLTEEWRFSALESSAQDHARDLTDLDPDGLFFFGVNLPQGATKPWSPTGFFWTPPATGTGTPFSFIAYGDNRTNADKHKEVVESILEKSLGASPAPRFALHSGDYTDGNSDDQWLSHFFRPVAALLPALPVWPCAGNHEYPTISRFRTRFPCDWHIDPRVGQSSNPCYLHFDYGRCRFTVWDTDSLDTYPLQPGDAGTQQIDWLSARLTEAASDPNFQWTFATLHVPLYTDASSGQATAHGGAMAGGHGWGAGDVQAVRNNLDGPLGNKQKLKVVLCGHNHFYERSFTANADHVTAGGGGAPGDSPAIHHRPPASAALHDDYDTREYAEGSFHHCLVTVSGNDLIFKAIRNDGSVLDFDAFNTNGQRLWDGNPSPTVLVNFGGQWDYKQGANLDAYDWQEKDYVGTGWSTGPAPFTFQAGGPGTRLIPSSAYPTYYFRYKIEQDVSSELSSMEFIYLELHLDDGCVVWLNNAEVFRSNLPAGANYATGALCSVTPPYDTEPLRCLLKPSALRGGTDANILAVEVHNYVPTNPPDPDLRFDLKLGYFKTNWRNQ
jgi:hypothetical protein